MLSGHYIHPFNIHVHLVTSIDYISNPYLILPYRLSAHTLYNISSQLVLFLFACRRLFLSHSRVHCSFAPISFFPKWPNFIVSFTIPAQLRLSSFLCTGLPLYILPSPFTRTAPPLRVSIFREQGLETTFLYTIGYEVRYHI